MSLVLATLGGFLAGTGPASALPDQGWEGEVSLAPWPEGGAGNPELAIGAGGDTFAVWHQSTGTRWTVWANRYDPGNLRWDVPVILSPGASNAYNPDVGVAGGGNAIAVWVENFGGRWTIFSSMYLIGGRWETPVQIDDAAGYDADKPRIAVGPAANAVAVWVQADGTQWSMYANLYDPFTGWAGAQKIDPVAGPADMPSVSIDISGNAVAVWEELVGGERSVVASVYTTTTGWTPRTLLESATGSAHLPSVEMDALGNAIAAWYQWDGSTYSIYANYYSSMLGWSGPTALESSSWEVSTSRGPRVAVNAAGQAYATWAQWDGSTGYDVYYNFYDPASGLTGPILAESQPTSCHFPDVAIDGSGDGMIVYRVDDSTGETPDMYASRIVPGVGLVAQYLIDTLDTPVAGFPRVETKIAGTTHAVWAQQDAEVERTGIRSNRYDPVAGWRPWGSEVRVEYDDDGWTSWEETAVNTAGAAVSTWWQDDGPVEGVYASVYGPATGWSAPAPIKEGAVDAWESDVGIDDAGNAIVAWLQPYGGVTAVLARLYTPSLGWTASKVISPPIGDAWPPKVAMNPSGTAFVAWRTWDGTAKRLWAARFTPTIGWDPAYLIDESVPNDILDPWVAVDGAGNAIVVTSMWDGGQYSIYAYHYTVGVGWGGSVLLEANPNHAISPRVETNAAGQAIAVWDQTEGPVYSAYAKLYDPLLGWGSATPVEFATGATRAPKATIDRDGDAIVAWEQWDGTIWSVYTNRYDRSLGWRGPVRLGASAFDTANMYFAGNEAGDAVVIYSLADGPRSESGYIYSAFAHKYDPALGWGAAERLETGAGDAWTTDVALDGAGDAVAVFVAYDGIRLRPWANHYVVGDGLPTLFLSSPVEGPTQNRVVVVAGVTDPGATLTIDGVPVAVDAIGQFTKTFVMPDGPHTFVVVASNLAGYSRTARATVTVDTLPPVLVIMDPPDGGMTNGNLVTVRGATEPDASVVVGTYATPVDPLGFFTVDIPLTGDGWSTIVATATDPAGNVATASVRILRDTQPPLLVIQSPSGETTNNAVVLVSGVTEIGATLTIDGLPVPVGPTGYFSEPYALPDGLHTFLIEAYDALFNRAQATADVVIDTVDPTITLTSPVSGLITNDPVVHVAGTTEPGASVTVNGVVAYVDPLGGFALDLALPEGMTTVSATARDGAGNSGTAQAIVTVDTVAPPLTLSSPSEDMTNSTSVLVAGVTEAGASVTVDGAPVIVGPLGDFMTTVTLTEGPHTFTVVATDPAGNTATARATITVDTTPPALALTAPANGATTQVASILVSGLTEAGAQVAVNGVRVAVASDGSFMLVLGLEVGANTITAVATDAAGNTATVSRTVTFSDPIPGLQDQISGLQDSISSLTNSLSAMQENLNALHDELHALEDNLTATQGDLAAANESIAGLGTQVLVLLVLVVVLIVLAALQFLMLLRMRRGRAREEAAEEEMPPEK